jgi:DNA-directed RNA polymerase
MEGKGKNKRIIFKGDSGNSIK